MIVFSCQKDQSVNPDIEYFLGDWEQVVLIFDGQIPIVFAEWEFNHDGSGVYTFKTDGWRDSSYQFWYEFNPRTNAFVVNNPSEDIAQLPIVTWYLSEKFTQDSFVLYHGFPTLDSAGERVTDTLVLRMRKKK